VAWSTYVAIGDSLTAGRGDEGRDGRPIGWAQRLADILSVRTTVRCSLTNLAVDGATVHDVLSEQLPGVAARKPDLVSVTVGINDIRHRGFDELSFKADLGQLFETMAATQATLLTCTLPDLTVIMSLSQELHEIARERMRLASDIIREQAESYGAGASMHGPCPVSPTRTSTVPTCCIPITGAISSSPPRAPTSWRRADPVRAGAGAAPRSLTALATAVCGPLCGWNGGKTVLPGG
jgi:lysophospholipase L1-like esterase